MHGRRFAVLMVLSAGLPGAAQPAEPKLAMGLPRAAHTATLLTGGLVLITGGCTRASCEMDADSASAELYDPSSRRFVRTGAMQLPRASHTATRLPDGRVLVAGGWTLGCVVNSAELYDPASGRFGPTGDLQEARSGHTATLLLDGRVLLTGGSVRGGTALASAEVYDPVAGTFRAVGSMRVARVAHVAVRLPDGRVLVAGGSADRQTVHRSVEVFDPVGGGFAPAGDMTITRNKLAGALLPSGRVLLMGGTRSYDRDEPLASVEVFDSGTGVAKPVGPMAEARYKFDSAVAALPDGSVLVGGGRYAERFDEATQRFRRLPGDLGRPQQFATATALVSGEVLLAGGYDATINPTSRAWLLKWQGGAR